MNNDGFFISRAIELGRKAMNMASPNPRVGCVLVKSGRITGEGWHRKCGGPHAEVEAVRAAGPESRGSTAYISLEPCSIKGRTPPCTELLISSGIRNVTFSVNDPSLPGRSSVILEKNGISVKSGVCETEGKELISDYIKFISEKKPLVTLKAAMSLDGKTATCTGESRWISGEASRNHTMRLRGNFDAILAGAGTIISDDPELSYRLDDPPAKQPLRVIVDGKLSINENARVIGENTLVITAEGADREKKKILRDRGASIEETGALSGRIAAADILNILYKKDIMSVLVEGGGETAWTFLKDGESDRVVFIYAPMIIGGASSPTSCGGEGFTALTGAVKLDNLQVCKVGGDVMVQADVVKRCSQD